MRQSFCPCLSKAEYGYQLHFDEWAERDLTDHLRRDGNHPPVTMWSVGNEVPEAQKSGEVETLKRLRDICHQVDPTRPVTVGCIFIAGANESGFTEFMDVVGYNGGGGSCFQYEFDHARWPKRLMYASEVPHPLTMRHGEAVPVFPAASFAFTFPPARSFRPRQIRQVYGPGARYSSCG